jgi:hypothetical protein
MTIASKRRSLFEQQQQQQVNQLSLPFCFVLHLPVVLTLSINSFDPSMIKHGNRLDNFKREPNAPPNVALWQF